MLDIGTWVMSSVMSSFQTYNITYSIPNIIVKSNMNVPTIMNPFLIRPNGLHIVSVNVVIDANIINV